MYRDAANWSALEAGLYENISQLGQLRAESIALRQGEYSTRLAMANLLAYEMTHDDQAMTVVLNRGGPTTMSGFTSNDTLRFGASTLEDGVLSVPAHSVSVIELNAPVENGSSNDQTNPPVLGCTDPSTENYDPLATEDDGGCIYPPPPVSGCTDAEADNFDPQATEDDGSCVTLTLRSPVAPIRRPPTTTRKPRRTTAVASSKSLQATARTTQPTTTPRTKHPPPTSQAPTIRPTSRMKTPRVRRPVPTFARVVAANRSRSPRRKTVRWWTAARAMRVLRRRPRRQKTFARSWSRSWWSWCCFLRWPDDVLPDQIRMTLRIRFTMKRTYRKSADNRRSFSYR